MISREAAGVHQLSMEQGAPPVTSPLSPRAWAGFPPPQPSLGLPWSGSLEGAETERKVGRWG